MTPPEVARASAAARPTRRAGRCASCRTCIRSSATASPGAHEVIVLSPAHDGQLDRCRPTRQPPRVIALRDRAAHHLDAGLVHAQPILNQGRASGASIEHPHAQLVALGFMPPHVEALLARFAARGQRSRRRRVRSGPRPDRSSSRDESAVTWCPPASSTPFVMRVALPYAAPALRPRDRRRDRACSRARCRTRSRGSALARRGRVQRRGAHRAARRSPPVPLVGRHRATGLGLRRLRARDRHLGQHRRARVGRRDAARRGTRMKDQGRQSRSTRRPTMVWRIVEQIERHVDWMADAVSITFTSAHRPRRRHAVRLRDAHRSAPDERPHDDHPVGRRAARSVSSTAASSRVGPLHARRGAGATGPASRWTERAEVPVVDGRPRRRARRPSRSSRAVWRRNLRR